jgi:hypothetical protein
VYVNIPHVSSALYIRPHIALSVSRPGLTGPLGTYIRPHFALSVSRPGLTGPLGTTELTGRASLQANMHVSSTVP